MDETTIANIKARLDESPDTITRVAIFNGVENGSETISIPNVERGIRPTKHMMVPEGEFIESFEITSECPEGAGDILVGIDPRVPYLGSNIIYDPGMKPISPGQTLPVEIPELLQDTEMVSGNPDPQPKEGSPSCRKEDVREWYIWFDHQDSRNRDISVTIKSVRGTAEVFTG